MAIESETHADLVDSLAALLGRAGLAVTARDRPGFTRPREFSGHRPDLIAEHLGVRIRVLGEAKIGPEIFRRHSLRQLAAFRHAMVPGPEPMGARLILAVPYCFLGSARNAARLVGVSGRTFVVGKTTDSWQITYPETAEVGSWPAFELPILDPSSLCAEDFMPREFADGDVTCARYQVSPI
jgi:hypothetical protein